MKLTTEVSSLKIGDRVNIVTPNGKLYGETRIKSDTPKCWLCSNGNLYNKQTLQLWGGKSKIQPIINQGEQK